MLKTFTKILIFILIAYPIIFKVDVSYADAPERKLEEYSIKELITFFADKYNVSETKMSKTMYCETQYRNIQSQLLYKFSDPKRGIVKGTQELSFGVSQIHLPDHPHITKAQALDPVFSTEFMAEEFSKGRQTKWSCYKSIYGVK